MEEILPGMYWPKRKLFIYSVILVLPEYKQKDRGEATHGVDLKQGAGAGWKPLVRRPAGLTAAGAGQPPALSPAARSGQVRPAERTELTSAMARSFGEQLTAPRRGGSTPAARSSRRPRAAC